MPPGLHGLGLGLGLALGLGLGLGSRVYRVRVSSVIGLTLGPKSLPHTRCPCCKEGVK